MNTRRLSLAALALVALASAQVAQAQITTGSVAGTVKDRQGGVIPGATVTLVNEAQGTRSTPVVTSPSGDFVFANVSSGTYAIDIEMPSFKELKRSGIVVSAGERVAVGALTLEIGGTEEVVDVRGEAPLIQATTGDRSCLENLPMLFPDANVINPDYYAYQAPSGTRTPPSEASALSCSPRPSSKPKRSTTTPKATSRTTGR